MIFRETYSSIRSPSKHLVVVAAVLAFLAWGCASAPPPQTSHQPTTEPLRISTYLISPGDAIHISIHGYSELDRTFRIPPDGNLYYPNVGDIQVSGMSISELRTVLSEKLESAEAQRIGPGSEIQISVYRHPDLEMTTIVPSSGSVNIPLGGPVQLSGRTVEEANNLIAETLARYVVNPLVTTTVRNEAFPGPIPNPQIVFEVLEFGGQKVMVLGAVARPGIYLLDGPSSLINVIAQAGGTTPDAKLKNVALVRPATQDSPAQDMLANLKLALEQGDLSQNLPVQRGDIVFVSNKTIADVAQFFDYVYRMVRPIVRIESGIWLYQGIEDGRSSGSTRIIFPPDDEEL